MVVFNKLAEICSQVLAKGTRVFISGRIKNKEFTNSQGAAFRKTEIVALEMIAFDKRKDQQK